MSCIENSSQYFRCSQSLRVQIVAAKSDLEFSFMELSYSPQHEDRFAERVKVVDALRDKINVELPLNLQPLQAFLETPERVVSAVTENVSRRGVIVKNYMSMELNALKEDIRGLQGRAEQIHESIREHSEAFEIYKKISDCYKRLMALGDYKTKREFAQEQYPILETHIVQWIGEHRSLHQSVARSLLEELDSFVGSYYTPKQPSLPGQLDSTEEVTAASSEITGAEAAAKASDAPSATPEVVIMEKAKQSSVDVLALKSLADQVSSIKSDKALAKDERKRLKVLHEIFEPHPRELKLLVYRTMGAIDNQPTEKAEAYGREHFSDIQRIQKAIAKILEKKS
ncbi:MAG: hypothetical protein KGZ39_07105 [Simkania sp.]|nr:hypothetical protein [Simkania sp.]